MWIGSPHQRMLNKTAGNLLSYKEARQYIDCSDLPPDARKRAITELYRVTGGNKWQTLQQVQRIQEWARRAHAASASS